MRVLHVRVEREGKWYVAQGLEERGVFTQGRTLDDIVANVLELMELMFRVRRMQIELTVPPAAKGADMRESFGRRACSARPSARAR